ncbi:hypothetical protein EPO15_00520 [bacterium]|nr:MAG: hypothetical protein EPO15_00520 [bacterium]
MPDPPESPSAPDIAERRPAAGGARLPGEASAGPSADSSQSSGWEEPGRRGGGEESRRSSERGESPSSQFGAGAGRAETRASATRPAGEGGASRWVAPKPACSVRFFGGRVIL